MSRPCLVFRCLFIDAYVRRREKTAWRDRDETNGVILIVFTKHESSVRNIRVYTFMCFNYFSFFFLLFVLRVIGFLQNFHARARRRFDRYVIIERAGTAVILQLFKLFVRFVVVFVGPDRPGPTVFRKSYAVDGFSLRARDEYFFSVWRKQNFWI